MRATVWLVLALVITFAAGATVGVLWVRLSEPPRHPERPDDLPDRLDLSESQREQMARIWEEATRERMHELDRRRRELGEQRDEAVMQLFDAEQREQFEAIHQRYEQETDRLRDARREIFEAAHEQSRAILTPGQQEQFDRIVAERKAIFDRHRRGRRGDDRRHRSERRPEMDASDTSADEGAAVQP